jgi:hypothetical protein
MAGDLKIQRVRREKDAVNIRSHAHGPEHEIARARSASNDPKPGWTRLADVDPGVALIWRIDGHARVALEAVASHEWDNEGLSRA